MTPAVFDYEAIKKIAGTQPMFEKWASVPVAVKTTGSATDHCTHCPLLATENCTKNCAAEAKAQGIKP